MNSDCLGISTIQVSLVNNIVSLFIHSTSGQFKMSSKLNFAEMIKYDFRLSQTKWFFGGDTGALSDSLQEKLRGTDG